MRSYKKCLIVAIALVLIFSIGSACASDLENSTLNSDDEPLVLSDTVEDVVEESSEVITVEDWDDLQYYCSLTDKDYVLKLKENTNYYPTNVADESYQIQVNNNVTIIGSSGAYFGDSSPNARSINYLAIDVGENSGHGITLKGVTFKWISSEFQPNAIFLRMAGNANNLIEDCIFTNITMTGGHSSVVQIMRGDVTLTNCSFTNITSDFGCLSLYDPNDDPTKLCTHARGEVVDCYFEGNYARTEPGCINNCGVLVVRNSTFYKNSAFWWAGAIHTHGGANTTIYDSNFTDNVAGWNGGALYTYSYLQIYNTIFKGNNCTTNNGGGAIGASKYLHSPYIHVENSLFEDNENLCWSLTELSTTGTGRGGAISLMDEGALTVLNTTFIKNSASIGTAICAISQGSYYGSPNVTIIGNRFINHTRVGDVLIIKVDYNSLCEIKDNYYSANSIEFSKLKLTADERVGDEVTLHIDAALKNSNFYDSDILEKSGYDVYMDGQYLKTVDSKDFTLNLKNIEKAQVYVVPSISVSKSNEVSVGLPKEYIYVSQKSGDDVNDGSKNAPVKTIAKAIELAQKAGNIFIMDGTFSETNLNINYNLSIASEGNAVISSKGNVFTIGDVEVSFKDITFKNCKQSSSSSERIINHGNGLLILDNCNFEGNSYYILVESKGSVEAENLIFKSNSGILIQADNYDVKYSEFVLNTADSTKINALLKSNNAFKCSISDSEFSGNNVKQGCVYFTTNGNTQNTLTVTDSVFSNNVGNDGASGIYIEKGMLLVDSSLFLNNTDTGSYSSVIFTVTEVHVSNSIFIANTMSNSNHALINAKSATNLKKIYCDGNWFGNTQDNYDVAPPISTSSNCNNWLFLNASANTTSLKIGETASVTFNLNNIYNRNGNVTYWDASNLPSVKLSISANGGKSSQSKVNLVYGMANLIYTLQSSEGSLIASYNGVVDVINFTEAKAKPEMTVKANNISVDDDEVITITLPSNATGSLTVTVGDITQNKEITSSITTFSLSGLQAGDQTAIVTYSGDEYYALTKKSVDFNVNKYDSATKLSVGEIDVGQDVVLTITVSPSVTGNVTLIINNKEETITLTNSKATYTIRSITRGDYVLNAVYNGNYKYSTSEDSLIFSVDKLNTTIDVNVNDIVYGQDAVVEVTLNDTATGNVTVGINGENTTSNVENGKATVNIPNLNAGDKQITVYYSGDNVFNPNSYKTSFNVEKANTALTINAADIMIGQDANIEVIVGRGVDGNISITCNNQTVIKTIPRTGKVSLKLSDLTLGEYYVSASLTSDNYLPVENTTKFKVYNYKTPQWPNEGYDTQNTGKSPYDVNSNGAILWGYDANNITGNLAIDCNGNIYVITATGVVAINDKGQLWSYNASDLSGVAIGRDVVIVPEAGNTIHFINQTTGLKFGNSNIYQGSSLFAPVIDSDANVYISSEYQFASDDYKLVIIPYSIWEKGGNPILISLGNSKPTSAPVVGDNIAVVACIDALNIIDLNKKQIISSIKGANNGIRPVIGPGNMIYAVLDGSIVELTPEGNQIWKTKVSDGIGNCLVLDEEKGLYSLNSKGNLYKYDLVDGSESLVSNLTFTSGILIGNDGEIYVGSNDMLYAFGSENNLLWKSYIGNEIKGSPVGGENGVIYIASSDKIYALSYAKIDPQNFTAKASDIAFGDVANIVVSLPKDATGNVSCEIGGKHYYGSVNDGIANIAIPDLSGGKHAIDVTYSGDNKYNKDLTSLEINVERVNATIKILNKDIYYSGDFAAVLSDLNGHPIANEKLSVIINGGNYELTTNNDGMISLSLKLNPDSYDVAVNFKGSVDYSSSSLTSQINMLSTIQANDMTRGYNSGVDFTVGFSTNQGKSLVNADVMFIVNGVKYNCTTDNEGVAILNKKLAAGTYSVGVLNPLTGENVTRQLTIAKRIVNNKDLTMDYLDGSYFKVRIIGDDGNYVGAGEKVTFKVGSKTYYATTNANGYASIKITEIPKTYAVKTTYKGFTVSNKLVVKQVLKAKNVALKKAKSYKFSATLKTSKGKAIAGKYIVFKIKGKTFKAKTNSKGIATATIKLNLNPGKYDITSTYSKTTIKNKLTIKK